MLTFSRLALLSALTATAVNALDCLTHASCQTVICDVFDDACPEDNICEQLGFYPWYLCHVENELESCDTHGCGAGTKCHQGVNNVYCTCDNMVVPAGESCTGAPAEYACTSMTCPESATCDTDGATEFCICDDGTVLGEYTLACPSPEEKAAEEAIEEEFDCTGNLACHRSATCRSNGDVEFCVCQNGNHMLESQICPGWSQSPEPVKPNEAMAAAFECLTCGHKACQPYPGIKEAGCYCDEVLVDPEYPCYHDVDTVAETCESHCMIGADSLCFIEHGVPVCRCTDGDLVGKDDDCNVDRTDTYTVVEGGCAFDVCGVGADCHHQELEGYTCTCGAEKILTAHYQDCVV
jgi:hypothetical protein